MCHNTFAYFEVLYGLCSYTWKIYAEKLLKMGSIYGFWRQVNEDQKKAKQRYIDMLYNLQFKPLVSFFFLLSSKDLLLMLSTKLTFIIGVLSCRPRK